MKVLFLGLNINFVWLIAQRPFCFCQSGSLNFLEVKHQLSPCKFAQIESDIQGSILSDGAHPEYPGVI
jgi:hypothetical protein